jgi:hypothetical protein
MTHHWRDYLRCQISHADIGSLPRPCTFMYEASEIYVRRCQRSLLFSCDNSLVTLDLSLGRPLADPSSLSCLLQQHQPVGDS